VHKSGLSNGSVGDDLGLAVDDEPCGNKDSKRERFIFSKEAIRKAPQVGKPRPSTTFNRKAARTSLALVLLVCNDDDDDDDDDDDNDDDNDMTLFVA
jgi:hypothetical protein